jgi:quercetin dioxygenase-like cupin family protein
MKKIVANADDLVWIDGPYPNTRMKAFPSDPESGTYTIMIDMPPGAVLERHDEPLNEVFYVLEGNLNIEGAPYGVGSYLFTPAGATHGPFESPDGCLILVTKFSR